MKRRCLSGAAGSLALGAAGAGAGLGLERPPDDRRGGDRGAAARAAAVPAQRRLGRGGRRAQPRAGPLARLGHDPRRRPRSRPLRRRRRRRQGRRRACRSTPCRRPARTTRPRCAAPGPTAGRWAICPIRSSPTGSSWRRTSPTGGSTTPARAHTGRSGAQGLAGGRPRCAAQAQILVDIGLLSHFVGDGSMPLHVSIHYNGWGPFPNPNGYTEERVHVPWEGPYTAPCGDAAKPCGPRCRRSTTASARSSSASAPI